MQIIYLLFSKGKLIKQGSPDEVITSELIDTVFGLDCEVIKDPVSNSPFIIPKGRTLC